MSISEHKHMPEPVRRIEVFTGAGRRRSWSPEEKAAIIVESYGAGETVCAVARRHGLTPQQLFAWRRLARRSGSVLPAMFVPAVMETMQPEPPAVLVRQRAEHLPDQGAAGLPDVDELVRHRVSPNARRLSAWTV